MTPKNADMLRQWAEEAALAFGLLTRFPLPSFEKRTPASLASAFWAYPLAGAVIGGVGAAAFYLASSFDFSTVVCVLLATAAMILANGGFHEDGLADFWDGIGGGKTREAKLKIMRDSRIGSYGVMALMLTLGLQTAFLVNLHHYGGLGTVICGLIACEAAARGALALPLTMLPPARADGLGLSMTELKRGPLAAGVLLASALAFGLLGVAGVAVALGAALGAAVIAGLAGSFLGGFTGDVLGAAAATARMAGLGALVLTVTP
jgi:adenosylcobinamide-GDP ribazoletransferase